MNNENLSLTYKKTEIIVTSIVSYPLTEENYNEFIEWIKKVINARKISIIYDIKGNLSAIQLEYETNTLNAMRNMLFCTVNSCIEVIKNGEDVLLCDAIMDFESYKKGLRIIPR